MTSQPKDAPRPKTTRLGIVLDAEKQVMQAMGQMRPVLEAATAATEPAIRMADKARKAFEIVIENARFPDPFSREECFIATIPREYPTTDEIAEAVTRKMKLGDKRQNRAEKKIQIPGGARWEDVRLDLKDNRSIDIFYKNERMGNFDYEDIGLIRKNTTRKTPDRQAEFLEKISFVSMSGSPFKPTVQDVATEMKITVATCHQVKKSLAEKLRMAFGIHNDPFLRYDHAEGYRTRFALRPYSLLRGDGELHASGGNLYEETTNHSDSDENY